MSFKKHLSFAVIVIVTVAACKKKAFLPTNDVSKTGVDVYVVGATNDANGTDVATYWKNGFATRVKDKIPGSYGYAIAVQGHDIYIAGSTYGGEGGIATYWKNGKATKLTDSSSANGAYRIMVKGTDI